MTTCSSCGTKRGPFTWKPDREVNVEERYIRRTGPGWTPYCGRCWNSEVAMDEAVRIYYLALKSLASK